MMTTSIDSAMGSAKEALGSARFAAKEAAEGVKDTADEAGKTMKRFVGFLRHIDAEDVLGLVGLRRRRSGLATIALVGGGVLVGAGITLLIAPASGREARRQLRKLFREFGGRAQEEVREVKEEAKRVAGEVKEKAGEVAGEVKEKVGQAQEKIGEMAGQATQGREGEAGGEGAQAEEGVDERKGRRRHNQNVQVS